MWNEFCLISEKLILKHHLIFWHNPSLDILFILRKFQSNWRKEILVNSIFVSNLYFVSDPLGPIVFHSSTFIASLEPFYLNIRSLTVVYTSKKQQILHLKENICINVKTSFFAPCYVTTIGSHLNFYFDFMSIGTHPSITIAWCIDVFILVRIFQLNML